MNRPELFAYLALPIVGVIGFAIGRLGTPDRKTENISRATTTPSTMPSKEVRPDESLENARTRREDPTAADELSATRAPGPMRPLERLRVLSQNSVGLSGILKVLSITSQLSAEEIPLALAMAKNAPRELREVMLVGAMGRWAEIDPRAAAEGARALKDREGNQAMEVALTEWAQQDVAAARAWIDALPKEGRQDAVRGYLVGLAMRDPEAALREATAMSPVDARRTYEPIFSAWAVRDPRTAAAHAATLPDGARDLAMRAVVGAWGRSDPTAALAWAQTLPNEKDRISSVSDVLRTLCANDPQLAIQQTLSLPEALRDNAARELIDPLMREGVEKARQFAESLPAGKGRDHSVQERQRAQRPDTLQKYPAPWTCYSHSIHLSYLRCSVFNFTNVIGYFLGRLPSELDFIGASLGLLEPGPNWLAEINRTLSIRIDI